MNKKNILWKSIRIAKKCIKKPILKKKSGVTGFTGGFCGIPGALCGCVRMFKKNQSWVYMTF